MADNIYAASREWARRPEDERYHSLDELLTVAQRDKETCKERPAYTRDLKIVTTTDGKGLQVNGRYSAADFTNYSFGQMAALIGAPARYLTTLPAPLAADCMNHGLSRLDEERGRTDNRLLVRATRSTDDPNEVPQLTLRAITSPKYSRIWDADIISTIKTWTNSANGSGRSWQLPMDWKGQRAGAYRSDRDMFLFLTDGGSLVEDPTLSRYMNNTPGTPDGGAQMYRGVIIRNSETGAASLDVETFYFRVVCGNHIIWQASQHKTYSRRHIGNGLHYTLSEGMRAVARWLDTPASLDEQRIRALAAYELGKTKEETIATLRGRHGLTETQATKAYDLAEKSEPGNPRSAWGIAQGLTRLSQQAENNYQDERYNLDSLAGLMLNRISRLVAA